MAQLEDLYVGCRVWHGGLDKGAPPWEVTVVKLHAKRVTVSFDQHPDWQPIRVTPTSLTIRPPEDV